MKWLGWDFDVLFIPLVLIFGCLFLLLHFVVFLTHLRIQTTQ